MDIFHQYIENISDRKILKPFLFLKDDKEFKTIWKCIDIIKKRYNILAYHDTITAIETACKDIDRDLFFKENDDGRLNSAISEKYYLNRLKDNLLSIDSTIIIEIPGIRSWYDICINGIFINLKLTKEGIDNAFNKTAIIYSLCGDVLFDYNIPKNMNFDIFINCIKTLKIKKKRDITSEYHYLVHSKTSGKFIIRSIIDISHYKSNPINILQIDWKKEMKIESNTKQYNEKIIDILTVVQVSLKKYFKGIEAMMTLDIPSFIIENNC